MLVCTDLNGQAHAHGQGYHSPQKQIGCRTLAQTAHSTAKTAAAPALALGGADSISPLLVP